MKRSHSLQRRRPVSLLEGLEGRRLFATGFTVTDLAPDTGGITHTGKAYGISDNGKVAMQYDGHAAYWSNGTVHDLGFNGYATDINDNGVVCGVDTSTGQSRPFVWNGSKTILSLNANTNGIATAINDSGTVVGYFFETGIASDGFKAALGGAAVNVGAPAGYEYVHVTGINDNGQINGEVYNSSTGYRAFIKSGSTFKLLGPLPGSTNTHTAHGIKNNGDVAIWGASSDVYSDGTTKIYHAYVVTSNGYGPIQDKGTLNSSTYDINATDINSNNWITGNNNPSLFDGFAMVNPGSGFEKLDDEMIDGEGATAWHYQYASAVNDSNKIVGWAYNGAGQLTPFLLTPKVAPATGSISGVLWNDSDGDGVKDAGESPSGVRQVFIDANGNKKLDPGELSTYSDASGKYKFSNLSAGTYKVTRVFPSGYKLSNNSAGYVTVSLSTGQNKTGVNLGTKHV